MCGVEDKTIIDNAELGETPICRWISPRGVFRAKPGKAVKHAQEEQFVSMPIRWNPHKN